MPGKLLYSGPGLAVLHEEYAKRSRIDGDAPVTSASSAVVNAPVHRVWELVSDIAGWPAWHPPITITDLAGVRPDAEFRWKLGPLPVRSTFAVVDTDRELTWSGRLLAYRAVDRHVLAPAGAGATRVTIEESLAGPLVPLLLRPAALRAGHERWLADLKRAAESR